jgi:hypothetical protein
MAPSLHGTFTAWQVRLASFGGTSSILGTETVFGVSFLLLAHHT